MSKVKQSDDENKNCKVRAAIAKGMELHKKTDDEIAIKAGITKRTFQNKKKHPETFTLRELRKICITLKLTDEEKIEIL